MVEYNGRGIRKKAHALFWSWLSARIETRAVGKQKKSVAVNKGLISDIEKVVKMQLVDQVKEYAYVGKFRCSNFLVSVVLFEILRELFFRGDDVTVVLQNSSSEKFYLWWLESSFGKVAGWTPNRRTPPLLLIRKIAECFTKSFYFQKFTGWFPCLLSKKSCLLFSVCILYCLQMN